MQRLGGMRALITGGTTGIGLEAAREFIREGARVAITGARAESVNAAAGELGPDVLALLSDAGGLDAQRELTSKIREHFGQLDVLLVNAGIADKRSVGEWTEQA